jgi:hypothetical protein
MISKASLISFRNLDLAWSRMTTAKNLQHKRMFRHLYSAYEPGRKANLQLLHEKLRRMEADESHSNVSAKSIRTTSSIGIASAG